MISSSSSTNIAIEPSAPDAAAAVDPTASEPVVAAWAFAAGNLARLRLWLHLWLQLWLQLWLY
jgi:hypothetical protein